MKMLKKTPALALAFILPLTGCPEKKQETIEVKKDDVAVNKTPAKTNDIAAPSDVASPPADALKTDSGLYSKVLQKAEDGAAKPGETDIVTVNYTGWTTDGKMFDSSIPRGQPAVFPLDKVIKGWTEGVQLMAKGEKRRFWIPEALAYGGRPGAPAGMLVFDVDLIDIKEGPKPIPAPADVAAAPATAQTTASGLQSVILQPGQGGDKPSSDSDVTVHYTGWTTNGKMFDSSVQRGQTAKFPLNAVIAGWTEGVALMTKGEKRRFWIPETLAYKGMPGKPAGTLVFDVELFDFTVPPKAPADVAKPAADAKKTASGLASKVLTKGTGKTNPKATDTVTVHYSGWTTDGKLFDSSVARGEPASFPLSGVIAGWTEGVQLMVEGEKRRFWIPVDLAYKGQPGMPPGMLVFDVELLKIGQ